MSTIGKRIKDRRIELDLSPKTVADSIGKDRATYYRYETDSIGEMPLSIIEPLAEVLKTTPAYLMGWGETDSETEKPATSDSDGLSEKQRKLLDLITKLDDSSLDVLIATASAILDRQQ